MRDALDLNVSPNGGDMKEKKRQVKEGQGYLKDDHEPASPL